MLSSNQNLHLQNSLDKGGCTIDELIRRVKSGSRRMVLTGLQGSSLPFLLAKLLEEVPPCPVLVVATDQNASFRLYEELLFYSGLSNSIETQKISYYPADEVLPYSKMLPDRGSMQHRLQGLLQLHQEKNPVLVMPAAALYRKVMPRQTLSDHSDLIQYAEELDREKLLKSLVTSGYQRVSVVEDRGTFMARGDILDIYSPLYSFPARIQLDDIVVESIRFFDPTTQRTQKDTEEFLIGPVDETLINPRSLLLAKRQLADLADQIGFGTLELKQLMTDLGSGLRPFGLQAVMPAFYQDLESIFDYLPPNAMIIMDDRHEIRIEAKKHEEKMQEAFELFVEAHHIGFKPDHFLLPEKYVKREINQLIRIESQIFSTQTASEKSDVSHSLEEASESALAKSESSTPQRSRVGTAGELLFPFVTRSNQGLKQLLRNIPATQEHRLQPLVDRIREWKREDLRIYVVCGSKGQSIRLRELLELYEIRSHIWDDHFRPSSLLRKPGERIHVEIYQGRISTGFVFPRSNNVLLSEEDIFGPKARKRRTKKNGPLQQSELQQLKADDIIIHRQHGLARYGGLHTITIDNVTGDFLLLEYHGKDRLYLPITRLAQIERYSGGGNPSIDRLKSSSFERKKTKAKAAIEAIAGDLLKLYAARKARKGFEHKVVDELYSQFESEFPFQETEDQLRAIEEIAEDLRAGKCMDRLICGDVGYGKTEIAMRAAFLSVLNGRQVAVLVPTTILAQQHGLNFRERMEGFPIKIAVLSRFQTTKENKESVRLLNEGKIDIVIGTHRLLARDVHFKNLGMLIIDEEHRFGVRHKERIKQHRQSIDVLTLTATPIPRTLEMSMAGIRDLSLITTPPHDRLAIRTTIAPYEDQIIREAIMRELNRGGQIFFVHNRVESIGKIQENLHRIAPEARTVVAHGQMQEGELERVMLDFIQGKFNLLLATSIIESGLDIARANTILINRADAFGLAQLYQIRGRVGRGKERAHALLLVPPNKRITPEAKQRLAMLQRFTELGAGFEIARHDLEMRGAGNILGKQQSGHIQSIGLELYMEMLQEAIDDLQGKSTEPKIETEVQLGINTYIPDSYVPDVQLRLQCYRRLSSAESSEELDQLSEEFVDRFGEQPLEVENLFQVMEIKQMLSQISVLSAKITFRRFRMYFHPDAPLDVDKILHFSQQKEPIIRILPNNGIERKELLSVETPIALSEIRQYIRQFPQQIMRSS